MKRPGRLRTPSSMDLEEQEQHACEGCLGDVAKSHLVNVTLKPEGRELLSQRGSVTSMLQADQLWGMGFSGKGVKVGSQALLVIAHANDCFPISHLCC